MPDEDVIDDGGLEPAAEPDGGAVAHAEPEPQPEVYTREQLAELLGPRFERFAGHEGEEAFRQFGSAYDQATGLIRQGAHLSPQDEAVYRSIGLDPSEVQQPEPEEEYQPGLFGTPWQVPTTWQEVQEYASSDDPNARRLAWIAVAQDPNAPDETKRAYFSHWAAIDPAGATEYNQHATMTAAEQRLAELEARLEARYAATHEDLVNRQVAGMMEQAKAQIPGFVEHAAGVEALYNERAQQDPSFPQRFFAAQPAEQLRELRRLTIIAAAEAEPARAASRAAATQQAEHAALAARTETSRTNGAPETAQEAERRREREQMRRVGARIT